MYTFQLKQTLASEKLSNVILPIYLLQFHIITTIILALQEIFFSCYNVEQSTQLTASQSKKFGIETALQKTANHDKLSFKKIN